MIPSHNSQPVQLQDRLLIEIKKLAAEEYKELNFTLLKLVIKKGTTPIWELIFLIYSLSLRHERTCG